MVNFTRKPYARRLYLVLLPLAIAGCQCKQDSPRARPNLVEPNADAAANDNGPDAASIDVMNANSTDEAPASQPSPTTQPTSAPASQPVPESPEYVRVIQTDKIDDTSRVTARVVKSSNELSLRTDNVRRLRILRQDVELDRSKSIVLRLDGQTFEWPANSTVTTFECSENGVWSPVKN